MAIEVQLELGPLQALVKASMAIAKASVRGAAGVVKKKIQSRTPIVSGSLSDSIGYKVGVYKGAAYAVVGPRLIYEVEIDGRAVYPYMYAPKVEAEHGDYLETLLDSNDMEQMRDASEKAIAKAVAKGT